jgi:cytochrome c oxidase assembly protein subunit 15
VLAVVVQGVLGGLRVVWREDDLAILHGSLAQAFFALVAALAAVTSMRWRHPRVAAAASTRALAVLASVLVYAQIVFGALLTHAGRIDLHLAGAVAVVVVLPILTARLRRDGDPLAAPLAGGLLGLLVLQLLLGAGSFLARFSSVWIPGEQLTMLVLPVVHRLAGSLLLGAVVILALRVVPGAARRTRPAAAPARLARQAP